MRRGWNRGLLCWPMAVLLLCGVPNILEGATKKKPVTLAVLAADFQFQGDWAEQIEHGVTTLIATGKGQALPAATAVRIPAAGRYRLWVCSRDFPNDRPGTRAFAVGIGAMLADKVFGTSGKEGYAWQDGGWFDLPAGPVLLTLQKQKSFARAQALLLTTDPDLAPARPLGRTGLRHTIPLVVAKPTEAASGELKITSDTPEAMLANDLLKIEFLPAQRGDTPTVAVRAFFKHGNQWIDAGADASAEGYFAIKADPDAAVRYAGFYATWQGGANAKPFVVEAGGASVRTIASHASDAMWDAGTRLRQNPRRATADADGVRIDFDPSPAGQLSATWSLPPGQKSAAVALSFVPATDGQVALGYELFFRRPLSDVAEVLLPFMWQRHRLPQRPTTLLDNCTPTPISLAQPLAGTGATPICFAVTGEPHDMPFGWPDGGHTHFGLSISDDGGLVQPSIWGPVIGSDAAKVRAGQAVRLRLHVLVQAGDWYAGYRTAADQIDKLRDYRSNVGVSLSDAALNMIDLLMDDDHGGWWDRAKGFYQIESKNGSTHAVPMLPLSIYRLTGNEQVYGRRALATMEFALSRDLPHFSPVPADTGPYPAGSMNGPIKLFGTGVFGGLWQLTGRRTDALEQIALPPNDVRFTAGYSHGQAFDEWLSRYRLTGAKSDLDRARELADAYIRTQIQTPPDKDLGPGPFFYISFVPDWEGLLQLYEATGRKTYLDAAAFGARQLMTGIWTQPLIPAGETTINPGGQYVGDAHHEWWKGDVRYRLGWPPAPGATAEKKIPAWEVSNVGLGFEQPITFDARGPARQIYEEAWAPHFLRLYRYTGDPAFLTYARNATVGRWGNYPGYYAAGLTDLPQNPRYPLTGPDVTDIYYHHIPAHLAWTIDYLVTEAEVLSQGRVKFPALRQHGYAYFDSRIFGAAPGRVFDDDKAWLIFRRGLASVDNPQINVITAHGAGAFHVIVTNQSQAEQKVTISLSRDAIGSDPNELAQASLRLGTDSAKTVAMSHGHATLTLPPRGLAVLSVTGLKLDVPKDDARQGVPPVRPDSVVMLKDAIAPTHAAAIQVTSPAWDAYVWSSASPNQAASATLHYTLGGREITAEKHDYPFEFSIHISDQKIPMRFHLDLIRADGSIARGTDGVVSLLRNK